MVGSRGFACCLHWYVQFSFLILIYWAPHTISTFGTTILPLSLNDCPTPSRVFYLEILVSVQMFIDFVNVENFVKQFGESTISTSTKSINIWSPTIILGRREYYCLAYYGFHIYIYILIHIVVIFVIWFWPDVGKEVTYSRRQPMRTYQCTFLSLVLSM